MTPRHFWGVLHLVECRQPNNTIALNREQWTIVIILIPRWLHHSVGASKRLLNFTIALRVITDRLSLRDQCRHVKFNYLQATFFQKAYLALQTIPPTHKQDLVIMDLVPQSTKPAGQHPAGFSGIPLPHRSKCQF